MDGVLKLENIEIEDKVVADALIEVIKNNKSVLASLKKSLFQEMQMLDTRTDEERARVA